MPLRRLFGVGKVVPMQRTEDDQAKVNQAVSSLILYHFERCPFCVMTRRAIQRLHLPIEERDILKEPLYRQELLEGGGRTTVPCLRIEQASGVHWMYESRDIIAYLEERFGESRHRMQV
ncbi:MAG: glutaredoxin [Gammaproteobacteria bacterium]|nr:MAG: glutaredoxin [Gammaproteobacteria bacterium]